MPIIVATSVRKGQNLLSKAEENPALGMAVLNANKKCDLSVLESPFDCIIYSCPLSEQLLHA